MNIIIKKVRVLAAPEPVFVGTRIRIKLDDPASLTWGMSIISLASGHERIAIEWGDGMSSEINDGNQVTHTYAQTGEYEVRISDDISILRCSSPGTNPSDFRSVYAPMIREVRTNATCLGMMTAGCLYNAINLHTFDCRGAGLISVGTQSFKDCVSLVGRIDLPEVSSVGALTFAGAIGLTDVHFAEEYKERISALPGFDTCFGAENARAVFDL